MKKYLFFVLALLFGMHTYAADQWVQLKSATPSKPTTTLISSNVSQSVIHLSVDGFWKSEVQTSQGNAWLINLGNSVRNLEKGAPDLPYVSTSVIIPDLSKMKVEVVSAEYKEFKNVLIAPSKGNIYRDVDPATVPYEFGDVYQVNSEYPGKLSQLNKPYIVRDYRGQAIWLFPVQYNPVTKTLTVFYDIEIKVSESGVAEINPFNRKKSLDKIDSRFYEIYKSHFLNFQTASRYDPVDEHGNMLIISYGNFIKNMSPFVTWKTQTGTHVEIVDVATIGGSAAIKQYVTDYYNDHGLTFLMLIGDAAQVPTGNAGGNDSDNEYTYVEGNDHYPDLFCGRFSAESEEHVITQVKRMIDYEKNPQMTDTTWYTQTLGIASNQGTGDDNEYDWEHVRNIQQNKLLPYTYVYDYEMYDGSHGQHDAEGNPTSTMVGDAIDDGVTIVNYTGHGGNTSWSTSGFSNSDVNNLTNAGKLPFIFSVACVNGNFVNNTCFAEAWMRAEDSFGNPTGAISTIMSTINQSWNPPMCGQDAMNDILIETYSDNIKRTFGGITMNGCMEMNDTYGSQGNEMTDTWTIFGDPSLMIRTAVPQELTATHPDKLFVGDTMMTISCPVGGAIATLSMNGEILGTATISGGTTTIFFDPPLANIGNADFVVIAYNHIPYMTTIPIVSDQPNIEYVNDFINDSLGNNNQQADYTEDIFLTIDLTNSGAKDAVDVVANISTTNPYVTLTDTTEEYGTLAPGDTLGKYNGYRFTLSDSVPDLEGIDFTIVAQDTSDHTWELFFTVIAHAPVLQYLSYEIIDTTGNGNGNGKLDAGETAELKVLVTNSGSANAFNVVEELSTNNNWISIENNTQSLGDIAAGNTISTSYSVTADGDTPQGYLTWFTVELNADYDISGSDEFSTIIGQNPVIIVKLAPTLSADSLMFCLEELSLSADTVSSVPENLNEYKTVYVLLGTFPDNHILTTEEGEQLSDYLNNGGKVYMEGGDTWAEDPPTAVHPMFNIEGLEGGTDDLMNILGKPGTIMEGYTFEFNGSNNYIDHIAPLNDAVTILTNEFPQYDVAVKFENSDYRTIGSSFEFGGLTDIGNSTKTGYLAEMLYFFDITFVWTGVNNTAATNIITNAYPNPFTKAVYFDVKTKNSEPVTLSIYDLQGRIIHTETITISSGNIELNWDAAANGINQGIYFYRLTSGTSQSTGKVIFTK